MLKRGISHVTRSFSTQAKHVLGVSSILPVKDILPFSRAKKGEVACITAQTILEDAAFFLKKYNVAALLVVEPSHEHVQGEGNVLSNISRGDISGILTERDVARAGAPSYERRVTDIMSSQLKWATENDTVSRVACMMLEHNIRHVPIFDEETIKLVGFLSIKDVLHACVYPEGEGVTALKARDMIDMFDEGTFGRD